MNTIIFPLEYKDGTRLIQYPEEPTLFKNCQVIGDEIACNYYGELDTYETYVWPSGEILSKYDFLLLVGVPTIVAIKTAAQTSVEVEVLVMLIENADEINLSETALVSGLSSLVTASVITQEESDRILQGV